MCVICILGKTVCLSNVPINVGMRIRHPLPVMRGCDRPRRRRDGCEALFGENKVRVVV
jgi:hypothetical protein